MARNRYFNVEFYPTFEGSKIHAGNFTDGELLIDWQKVEMPRQASRLLGVTAFIKGNAGTLVRGAFELLFATSDTNSIDGVNDGAVVASNVSYFRDTIGYVNMDIDENSSKVPGFAILHAGSADEGFAPLTLAPAEGNGHIYVAAIKGATNFNFATGVLINDTGGVAAGSTSITVDGADATTRLTVGDDLVTQNDLVIGKIKSITSATEIELEAPTAAIIPDNKKVLSQQPMKFIFHFEI